MKQWEVEMEEGWPTGTKRESLNLRIKSGLRRKICISAYRSRLKHELKFIFKDFCLSVLFTIFNFPLLHTDTVTNTCPALRTFTGQPGRRGIAATFPVGEASSHDAEPVRMATTVRAVVRYVTHEAASSIIHLSLSGYSIPRNSSETAWCDDHSLVMKLEHPTWPTPLAIFMHGPQSYYQDLFSAPHTLTGTWWSHQSALKSLILCNKAQMMQASVGIQGLMIERRDTCVISAAIFIHTFAPSSTVRVRLRENDYDSFARPSWNWIKEYGSGPCGCRGSLKCIFVWTWIFFGILKGDFCFWRH